MTVAAADAPATLAPSRSVVERGRYPGGIKFGDGGYADTVAMGLVVEERPAASRA